MSDVVNRAFFHFAFFLGLVDVAGNRVDVEGAQKLQKLVVEAHHWPLMFNDRGEHVVVHQLLGGALEKVKGAQQTTVQGLLSLGMGKFEIQQAAITFDDGQAVET